MQLQTNTIAKIYAKAIFSLACEQQNTQSWQEFLATTEVIVNNEEMQKVINNPSISNTQVLELFLTFIKNILPLENNFLQLIIANGRVEILNFIYKEFLTLLDASKNILDGKIISAYSLDDKQKAVLHAALAKKFNKELRLEFLENPDLIGGAIIYIADLIFDGSCRNQLLQLSEYINKGNVLCN